MIKIRSFDYLPEYATNAPGFIEAIKQWSNPYGGLMNEMVVSLHRLLKAAFAAGYNEAIHDVKVGRYSDIGRINLEDLDKLIVHWRGLYADKSDVRGQGNALGAQAEDYIDALSSARVTLFGEELP